MKDKKTEPPKMNTPEVVYDREKIKAGLNHGDCVILSSITGYSQDYINDVLNDHRKNNQILAAAQAYIHQRDLLKEELSGKYHRDQIQEEHEAA